MNKLIIKSIKILSAWLVLLLFVLSTNASSVAALSEADLHSIYNDSVWYKVGVSTGQIGEDSCLGIALPDINDESKIAEVIDAFIKKHAPSSPLLGLGKDIVEGAVRQGVNPLLIVAIAGQESSWGTDARTPVAQLAFSRNNAFGNLVSPGNPRSWPSWQASVNDPAGDDEPSLIKNTYLSDPKVTNLYTFVAKYLTGSTTGTTDGKGGYVDTYYQNVRSWMSELIGAASGALTCTVQGSGSASAIVQYALLYAWPTPPEVAGRDPLAARPEYLAALDATGRASCQGGADCGVFVATVMHNSGADPNYPSIGTSNMSTYVRANPQLYDVVERVNSTAELLPGDILIVNAGDGAGASGHTWIYVGPQSGGYYGASASFCERMPNLGQGVLQDSRGYYLRARLR